MIRDYCQPTNTLGGIGLRVTTDWGAPGNTDQPSPVSIRLSRLDSSAVVGAWSLLAVLVDHGLSIGCQELMPARRLLLLVAVPSCGTS